LLVGLVGVACLAFADGAVASGITNAGDDLRTGWYPDEGAITPQIVSGGTFGQLWSANVAGQVYAQPLLSPDGTLIVATENDKVYGLDPATGAQQWTDTLGSPWNPADIGCSDIVPSIGTTSTPVIDPSTRTVYLTYKTYDGSGKAVWFMAALDVATGQERTGFPVQLNGTANNAPSVSFDAQDQQQRPGLLLMNGVVYAGFGSHCDATPYTGWIFGVSTAGRITARWASTPTTNGGGVWQSGAGLTSDVSGSILFATGNGGSPPVPAPGNSPPSSLGDSVVRLAVQPDGSLKPVDFFAPFDAAQLDQWDADFGSGGVVGLPDQYFGTQAVPHLAVAVGKEGYVYLLNRDNLGGYKQGTGGGDSVVQSIGPRGGVWGRAGVWPGDGGYVYIPTSTGQSGGGLLDVYQYGVSGSGTPSLSLAASSSDVFGWGSGSPVITSESATSGSALVWIIWSADRQGDGGQLRAYDPVPVNGQLTMRYSASIGTATNYSTPGVGAGRLYVGTRDGHVLAFGSPVTQPLSGSALSFPRTTIGSSSGPETMTLTANRTLTISTLRSSSSQFSVGTPSPGLPATLSAGQTISVPVTFTPTQTGLVAGQLTAGTDAGDVSFSLSGTGQPGPGQLAVSPPILSLGGTTVGGHLSATVSFSNVGGQPITISAVHLPSAPFSATGAPVKNDTIAPGASITVDISFDPTNVGPYTDAIGLDTDGGNKSIGLSASAGAPGQLQLSSQAIDFAAVAIGATATKTFTISNLGGTNVTIEKSKPPFGGAFTANSSLPEGTTIGPGQTLTESVTFTPATAGATSGTWQITGNDGTGLHAVQFTGSGATPSAPVVSGASSPPSGSGTPPIQHPSARPIAPKFLPAVATTAKLTGTYITYTALTRGISQFVLEELTEGRMGAHGCVPTTSRNRFLPRCTRFVEIAAFRHADRIGAITLRLAAFVPVRKLAPGSYRLRSILLDTDAVRHTFYSTLRVITPPRRGQSVRHVLLITPPTGVPLQVPSLFALPLEGPAWE
jgi:hypothetical protein